MQKQAGDLAKDPAGDEKAGDGWKRIIVATDEKTNESATPEGDVVEDSWGEEVGNSAEN